MVDTKNIYCYFLRVKTYIKNQGKESEEYFYTLHNYLMDKNILKDTKREIRGKTIKIHKIEFHEDTNLLELQLLRYRNSILPGTEDKNTGEFELIEIDEGKRLAEFTTIIYDYRNSCILFHNNYNSLSVNVFQEYLNKLIELPEKKEIILLPIIKEIDKKIFRKNSEVIFKNMEISIDLDDFKTKDEGLLSIIKNFENTNSKTLRLYLSMGRKKNSESLSHDDINKLVSNFKNIPNSWNSFKLGYKENMNKKIETIDLIENKMVTAFEFTYDRLNPITHERIYEFFEKDYRTVYMNERPVKI